MRNDGQDRPVTDSCPVTMTVTQCLGSVVAPLWVLCRSGGPHLAPQECSAFGLQCTLAHNKGSVDVWERKVGRFPLACEFESCSRHRVRKLCPEKVAALNGDSFTHWLEPGGSEFTSGSLHRGWRQNSSLQLLRGLRTRRQSLVEYRGTGRADTLGHNCREHPRDLQRGPSAF